MTGREICRAIIATVCLMLPAISCNIPATVATPTPTHMPTPAATTAPIPASLLTDLVWFAPNMGSSDYAELFNQPAQWAAARAQIDVFKFYTQNVLSSPCAICGDNTLPAFVDAGAFQQLTDWGIAISIEVGAVKEWGCTGEEEFRIAEAAIQNVETNGGRVSYLAMDEPYIGGELVANGQSCEHIREQSASSTAYFVRQIKANFPDMIVGDIEPYPYFSLSELKQWIIALEDKGVALAFFHLDVDLERVRVEGQDVTADLQALSQFCQERGIPFGVIFTSNWREAGSDRTYFDSTIEWVHTVNEAMGSPEHLIFQSWQGPAASGDHEVPLNLPQDGFTDYSHIRLISEGLAILDR